MASSSPPNSYILSPKLTSIIVTSLYFITNLSCMAEQFNFSPSSDNFSLCPSATPALDDIQISFWGYTYTADFFEDKYTIFWVVTSLILWLKNQVNSLYAHFAKVERERQRQRERERQRERKDVNNDEKYPVAMALSFTDKLLESYLHSHSTSSPLIHTSFQCSPCFPVFCSIETALILVPKMSKPMDKDVKANGQRCQSQWTCFSAYLIWYLCHIYE